MRHLFLAFQFLTIIPLKVSGKISEEDIGISSALFPLVGAFQGAFLVITAVLLRKIFPLELTNGLLILLHVLSNGGFHLDGLADTFDAIASRGSIEKKLSIMKDSTIGPVGVIAIVFTLLLKFFSLHSLSLHTSFIFYLSLFLMPAISKWMMVISMFHGKPAREYGLGRIFTKNVKPIGPIFSTFLISLFFALAMATHIFLYEEDSFYSFLLFFVLILTLFYLLSLVSVRFFKKAFGGLTGDTLGAISEITELAFLLIVIIWSQFII